LCVAGRRRLIVIPLSLISMSRFVTRYTASCAFAMFVTACATRTSTVVTAIAPITTQRVVASATGKTIPFSEMADAAAKADVIFFGEQHDDDETHRAELALLKAVGERRTNVVLSLEMFERDVQAQLDAYLAGTMSEDDFRAQSRPWPNYAADYRPLVELAKEKKWRVIASNVPRRLASGVSRRGLASIDSLPASDRALVARDLQCPKGDQYYKNFVEVMSGHGPGDASSAGVTDRFYEAQCVKDETMAESIANAMSQGGAGAIVVHFNGAFHSDYGLGTASRVTRRLPAAKSVVVSAVPQASPSSADVAEFATRGTYIIFALRLKP
jgi:uncharacterized iron-regulated protein